MSDSDKSIDKPKKKRGTRLKGTDTHKPCVDCGELKDRFSDFKPRWAGCATHRTEKGRRYFEPGCVECASLVNGNIRQPRCIECDKSRTKKGKAPALETVAPSVESTEVQVIEVPEVEGIEVVCAEDLAPSPEMQEAAKAIILPEPVEVAGLPEASPESVKVPEPEPVKPRPKIASMADLSRLFDTEVTSE